MLAYFSCLAKEVRPTLICYMLCMCPFRCNMLYPLHITSKFTSCATPSFYHFGMAPLRRPRPFAAPLLMGVALPPLPRELRRLAWLGALLACCCCSLALFGAQSSFKCLLQASSPLSIVLLHRTQRGPLKPS